MGRRETANHLYPEYIILYDRGVYTARVCVKPVDYLLEDIHSRRDGILDREVGKKNTPIHPVSGNDKPSKYTTIINRLFCRRFATAD